MERKYTISQVANGWVVTPDYKENLNRNDLNVFNTFPDMVGFLEKSFAVDADKSLTDKMADDITREEHEKLRESRENKLWEDADIRVLNLNCRPFNALQVLGLRTIRDVNKTTDLSIMRLKNIGRKTLTDIRYAVDSYRLKVEAK